MAAATPQALATPPVALSIAGSDSSSGAGIQADLKTFAALGVYGATVITALTAQNTTGVQAVHKVPAAFVAQQARSVLSDLDVRAIKTGMLADAPILRAVGFVLAAHRGIPLVVDPVMIATSGDALLDDDAIGAFATELFAHATLITPNLPEAARLLGTAIAVSETDRAAQAEALGRFGSQAVLLKGGHGGGSEAVDLLWIGGRIVRLASPRLDTQNTHGTGCTLAAAITAYLARGAGLEEAVRRGRAYLQAALAAAIGQRLGRGHGPVDHQFARRGETP